MMPQYPEGTTIDIDAFRRSGWKSALESSDRKGYHAMSRSLSSAAKAALESGDASQGKVLWLLADACSMRLKSRSANEPFEPLIAIRNKRSSLAEDFQESDVSLLAQIAEEVNDPWLQARLADLVWLLRRSHKHALLAIDAYRAIPLDAKTWLHDGQDCWERAITLTLTLRSAAGERLEKIEAALMNAFQAASEEDNFFSLWISDLLLTHGLCQDKNLVIAERLQSLARFFEERNELHRSRQYFAGSANRFKRARNEAKAAEMTVCIAKTWVKEAIARTSSESPSHLVAASFYENAIQTYLTVPRRERASHNVEKRLAELHMYMREAKQKGLGEMEVTTSLRIDIIDFANEARNAVKGKTVSDALHTLAKIHPGFREAPLRKQAEEVLSDHPLQGLFPVTHMSWDGRTVAKRLAMGSGEEEHRANVRDEMIATYTMGIHHIVLGQILPALEVIACEHRVRENDFISFASQSPIVPKGRERLYGKALFAGYERDFVEALHLLVPQIENMVRYHFKTAGIKTTMDKMGVENETGLSTLINLTEAADIFGEDIVFEIKALFCDPVGPNLRNQLAHGLLEDGACRSVYSVYAWWFGLKLAYLDFCNPRQAAGHQADPGDAGSSLADPE